MENNIVVVTMDSRCLRAAHIRMPGNDREVVKILRRDIRGISADELPQTVRSAIDEINAKKPQVVYVIPSDVAITKNIEVPSLDPEEIRSIINLQAGRHTPYSREEIIVGYANIGVYQRNYSKILLVIINRDVIKKRIDIFEEIGSSLDHIVFGPEAKVRFYASALKLNDEQSVYGLIDVANQSTDFIIGLKDKIVSCRNIPVGMLQLIKEGATAQEKLTEELKTTLNNYKSEDIEKEPSSYVLTGNSGRLKDLRPVLQDALGAPVKVVPFLDNIKSREDVRQTVDETEDESFLDVIAPALCVSDIQVDLVPEEIKMQKSIAEQAREFGKAGILVSVLLLIICGIFISKIHFKSTLLERLKDEYAPKHVKVEALEKIAAQTRLVKDYLNNRMVSLKMIDEIYGVIPDEIYLNSIVLDEEGRIIIQGISESMSQVFSFVTALEESDFFKSVKTRSTTAKKERGKDVAAFEIAFKLESARDDTEQIAMEDLEATGKEPEKK